MKDIVDIYAREDENDLQELNKKNKSYILFLEDLVNHYEKTIKENEEKRLKSEEKLYQQISDLKEIQKNNTVSILQEKRKNRHLIQELDIQQRIKAQEIEELEEYIFGIEDENRALKEKVSKIEKEKINILKRQKSIFEDMEKNHSSGKEENIKLNQQVTTLESSLKQKEESLKQNEESLKQKEESLKQKEAIIEQLSNEKEELLKYKNDVENSKGWKLLNKIRSIKNMF